MAWIESHQELERHPKTLRLMTLMGWDLDQTIGKLHRFWWWCVAYALDGDLRKFNDAILSSAVGLNPEDGKRFVDAMVECGGEAGSGFIDRTPYFRVHDWWDRIGIFLQIKFKHQADKWQAVRNLYCTVSLNGSNNRSHNGTPNQPNLTNQPKDVTSVPEGPTPEDLVRLWNKEAHPNLPKVERLTEPRKRHAKARLAEHPAQEFWEALMFRVNRSPLLTGQIGKWKASFDWVIKESNFVKILEGNYDPDKRL